MNTRIPRRAWLKLVAGAAGGVVLVRQGSGCAYFAAESGDAYAPWDFPGTEMQPEMVAARAAILAANPHNSQPWALRVTEDSIDLHADFEHGLGTIDSLQRELYIGLGCALENLVIAARASGRAADVALLPDPAQPSLVASVALTAAAPAADPLFDAIARRHTNRGRYSNAPPSAGLPAALQAVVTEAGVVLRLLTSAGDKASFRAATIDATKAFIADAEMSRESNSWYRQTAAQLCRCGPSIAEPGCFSMYNVPGKMAGIDRSSAKAKASFAFRSEGPLGYDYRDVDAQKRMLAEAFAGLSWHTQRLVDAALADPNCVRYPSQVHPA